jgi:hypothetical protein
MYLNYTHYGTKIRVIVFYATFNNILTILWQSVLFIIGGGNQSTRRNHRPVASLRYWQTLSHNVVVSTPLHEQDSNSQLEWWWALIAQVIVNPTVESGIKHDNPNFGTIMCIVQIHVLDWLQVISLLKILLNKLLLWKLKCCLITYIYYLRFLQKKFKSK